MEKAKIIILHYSIQQVITVRMRMGELNRSNNKNREDFLMEAPGSLEI